MRGSAPSSAMVPPDKRMVLSMEQVVPQRDVRSSSSTMLSRSLKDLARKLTLLHWGRTIDSQIRHTRNSEPQCHLGKFLLQEHKSDCYHRRPYSSNKRNVLYACAKISKWGALPTHLLSSPIRYLEIPFGVPVTDCQWWMDLHYHRAEPR